MRVVRKYTRSSSKVESDLLPSNPPPPHLAVLDPVASRRVASSKHFANSPAYTIYIYVRNSDTSNTSIILEHVGYTYVCTSIILCKKYTRNISPLPLLRHATPSARANWLQNDSGLPTPTLGPAVANFNTSEWPVGVGVGGVRFNTRAIRSHEGRAADANIAPSPCQLITNLFIRFPRPGFISSGSRFRFAPILVFCFFFHFKTFLQIYQLAQTLTVALIVCK